MKKLILLAATATLAFSGIAYADHLDQDAGLYDRPTEWSRNLDTTQPSGGKVADNIAAPTAGIAGSVTGAANMNGPLRNGQAVDPFWERSTNSGPYSSYND